MSKFVPALAICALSFLPLASLAAGADSAKEFVTEAIQGDNSEIMLGQLAEQHGGSQGVRDFGKTLTADHGKAKDEMMKLATSMSITPPTGPKPEAKMKYDQLSKLNGAQFDREFVKGMVEDHQKDIAEFEKQAKAGNAASKVAENQLPTLRKHLDMAKSLQAKL